MDTFTINRNKGMKILLSLFFVLAVMIQALSAAVVDVYLRTDTFTITMPDGQVITMWGFSGCTDNTYTSCSAPTVPGPYINATVGDTLNIYVQNNLTGLYTEPVSIHIPGQIAVTTPTWTDGSSGNRTSVTQRVRSFAHEAAQGGGTATYTWNSLKAGTYLYQSATHPSVQIQMGLFGVLEVNAAAGPPVQAYNPATTYDIDLALVFSEIDPAVHAAVAAGTYGVNPASTIHYNPKYFLINGKPFTYGESAIPIGTPTQTTLLRFLNAGLDDHVPLFQGLYMKILAEDGKLYPYPKDQYSVHLPAGKTVDAVLSPTTAGYYPLYDRRLYLTNAAVSPGGMLAFLKVTSTIERTLSVSVTGTGNGRVDLVSMPGGISCLPDCTETINDGTEVTLAATPSAGSFFIGWSGDCTGLGICTLVMNAAKSVTANFISLAGFSISGNVQTTTGSPLAGVTVALSGAGIATTTTDVSGNYSFGGLANGAYTITPNFAGYTFSPINRNVTVNNADVTGLNFTGTLAAATYSVSGTVATARGAPIAGVTITLSGAANATTTTDANGNYTFTGLVNGAYTVTPSFAGYTFSPLNRNVTVNNANVTGQNFTGTLVVVTYSISGTVGTAGGAPIAGVTLTLSGAANATIMTNAAGTYSFTGLANGVYTVTPSLTGYTFSPLNRNMTISGANVTGQNFTGTADVTYFIRGYVKDSNGNLMGGVTMKLSGAANATIFTDASGNYQFSGLLPGSYIVTPSFSTYIFSPTSRFITITNASFTGQEFVGTAGRR